MMMWMNGMNPIRAAGRRPGGRVGPPSVRPSVRGIMGEGEVAREHEALESRPAREGEEADEADGGRRTEDAMCKMRISEKPKVILLSQQMRKTVGRCGDGRPNI